MSRTLPAAFKTAVTGAHYDFFYLVEMQLLSGTLRLCSLDFDVDYAGNTYTGLRGLGTIAAIEETPGTVTGLTFQMAGITEAHIAAVLAEPIQGRTAIIRIAVLDKSTNPPGLAVDSNVWQGLLDVQRYNEGASTVTVTAENRLVEWDRPRLLRYTDEDHKRAYPSDGFFKLVPQMAERQIILFSKEALAKRV
jgi:hypothetical protein